MEGSLSWIGDGRVALAEGVPERETFVLAKAAPFSGSMIFRFFFFLGRSVASSSLDDRGRRGLPLEVEGIGGRGADRHMKDWVES